MKLLMMLVVGLLFATHLAVNNAVAMCVMDSDWPDKPCIDTSPPLPLSKSEWKTLWAEYFNFKGVSWMEQQYLDLEKQLKSGTLKEWIESGYDTQDFKNYNVWFYYYVNDLAPAPEGYGLEHDYNMEFLSPLKQFKSGIASEYIQCKSEFELVIKSRNDTPACVKSTSISKLIERGWTNPITFTKSPVPDTSSIKIITLADNDKLISIKKGEQFLLKLGDDYNWNVEINDQNIISRVHNIMVVKGVQGVYESHNLGNTVMTTTGSPICLNVSPPCMQPSLLLTWNIEVTE